MVINAYKIVKPKENININLIVKEITNKIIGNSKKQDQIIKIIETILLNEYQISEDNIIKQITNAVLDNIYGYGIFQKYLDDKITSDIRVVAHNRVYIKQKGKWIKTNDAFETVQEFEDYIRFCALKNNYNINYENPIGVFSDRNNSLRIEAGIEPANVCEPSLVIRIHKKELPSSLERLKEEFNMIDNNAYGILKTAIKCGKSIILCGKGGSGKTTLLKALINEIPEEIAINTNEETAELYLQNRNVIQRECILTRNDGKNIDLEKLSRHALVMSNDVIVVGELKGKEANSFFDSISTGHMGLATIHSDSAFNTIDRIITLIKKDTKAIHYTEEFLRRFLSNSIDYIVFLKDFKVVQIAKILYDIKNNKLHLKSFYNIKVKEVKKECIK